MVFRSGGVTNMVLTTLSNDAILAGDLSLGRTQMRHSESRREFLYIAELRHDHTVITA
jgi:hypothetical protein